MSEYPVRVPKEEQPEATIENVPDSVLENAIGIAVTYGECPHCGERQFHPIVPGHNSGWNCVECDGMMRVVG